MNFNREHQQLGTSNVVFFQTHNITKRWPNYVSFSHNHTQSSKLQKRLIYVPSARKAEGLFVVFIICGSFTGHSHVI